MHNLKLTKKIVTSVGLNTKSAHTSNISQIWMKNEAFILISTFLPIFMLFSPLQQRVLGWGKFTFPRNRGFSADPTPTPGNRMNSFISLYYPRTAKNAGHFMEIRIMKEK